MRQESALPTPRLTWSLLSALFLFLISSAAHAADPASAAGTMAAAAATDSNGDSVDTFVMPPNAEVAYQEYVKNNDRIDTLQRENEKQLTKLGNETELYEMHRKRLETNLRVLVAVAGKCGNSAKDEEQRRQQAEEVRSSMKAVRGMIIRGDSPDYVPKFDADFKILCQTPGELTFLRGEQVKDYLEQIEAMRTKWVQAAQSEIEKRNKEKSVRERQRGLLAGAMEKLKTQTERTSNFSDLKWLVLILGVLSVTVMLIVRTFPVELQTEWVASGQVIQFMTVLIILIAILSLGINGILKEETLGTLLGGIGGYVLAQGVGRAALRNALSGTAVSPPSTTTTAIFPTSPNSPSMSAVSVAVQPPASGSANHGSGKNS
jgi:hypothetical protein